MKPFGELTIPGKLRRFREAARKALEPYGLQDSHLTFLTYHGNVIYRVDTPARVRPGGKSDRYAADRYVLRLHMDYHTTAAIRSELQWLSALRRDADMPVPEPMPTSEGELSTEVAIPGSQQKRKCSLLRWLNGRFLKQGFRPRHARAWGRLMGQLHKHASSWQRPNGFTRRHNDWDGLFGDGARFEFPARELWQAVPGGFRGPFEEVTCRVRRVMNELGDGPDVYGLVHSDLDVKTNVLFAGNEARVIDFDDSGFAYWIHDLAFALSPWQGSAELPWIRDALLDGYAEIRSFPEPQLKHLGLFMAAFNATLMLWMIDWAKLCPESSEPTMQVNKYGRNLLRYFEQG